MQIVDHEDRVSVGAVQVRDDLRGFSDWAKIAERLAEREVRDVFEHLHAAADREPSPVRRPEGPHERRLADSRFAADETRRSRRNRADEAGEVVVAAAQREDRLCCSSRPCHPRSPRTLSHFEGDPPKRIPT
jgi:hypothetical protein